METLKFTTASDVWAWAITVCEIFNDGLRPYDGMNNALVITQIMAGYRHPCPTGCPPAVYNVMTACWKEIATERPTFEFIANSLSSTFDRSNLKMGVGLNVGGGPSSDDYNIGGDAAPIVDDNYNIAGDGAGNASPAVVEESSYNIGGDGAAGPATTAASAGYLETQPNAGAPDDAMYADMGDGGSEPTTTNQFATMVAASAPFTPTATGKTVYDLADKAPEKTGDSAGLLGEPAYEI